MKKAIMVFFSSLMAMLLPSISGMSLTLDDNLSGRWLVEFDVDEPSSGEPEASREVKEMKLYEAGLTTEHDGQTCKVYLVDSEDIFGKGKPFAACLLKNVQGSPFHFFAIWTPIPGKDIMKLGGAFVSRIEDESFIIGIPSNGFKELGKITRIEQFPPNPFFEE